jgi:hypothetical protein
MELSTKKYTNNTMKKTNKKWYRFTQYNGYYKLIWGVLYISEITMSGSRGKIINMISSEEFCPDRQEYYRIIDSLKLRE